MSSQNAELSLLSPSNSVPTAWLFIVGLSTTADWGFRVYATLGDICGKCFSFRQRTTKELIRLVEQSLNSDKGVPPIAVLSCGARHQQARWLAL
jgi:hypothetical protein